MNIEFKINAHKDSTMDVDYIMFEVLTGRKPSVNDRSSEAGVYKAPVSDILKLYDIPTSGNVEYNSSEFIQFTNILEVIKRNRRN